MSRHSRLSFVGASLLGAFCVYCTQSAVTAPGGVGGILLPDGAAPVGNASAQGTGGGCCTPPAQTFTKLADVAFTFGVSPAEGNRSVTSSSIDVRSYREIIFLKKEVTTTGCYSSGLDAHWRLGEGEAWGTDGQGGTGGGRLRVQAPELALTFRATSSGSGSSCQVSAKYVVIGVSGG